MNIFKCTMNDWDPVTEFYDRVTEYLDKNINYPKWTHKEYPGRESVYNSIKEGSQFACEDNRKIIGAFVLNDDPQGAYHLGHWSKDFSNGEYLIIHALASDPDIYGKGIAKSMVKYCIETTKERGYGALRLDVVPTNIPARRLYEKMGFTFVEERDLLRGIEYIPAFALYEMNL